MKRFAVQTVALSGAIVLKKKQDEKAIATLIELDRRKHL